MKKILLVDDETAICASLSFALESDYEIHTAGNAADALSLFAREDYDIVLLDLRLGTDDGLAVLRSIKQADPDAAVVIMTAYGSIQSSVAAMKQGAFYYITKPINMDELKLILSNACEYLSLRQKVWYFNNKLADEYALTGMIGRSEAMKAVFSLIEKVANTGTNVLITGESGTGKELVARAIHFSGTRRSEPFEVINCAAIPAGILESELFGYERGAFTGATRRKKGIFELAHKGTLFLDEIAEMDANLQSKLLRVVQDKEIIPLGGGDRRKVDVRLIAATNRDLAQETAAGRFREDLFFRLNVLNIHLPPLRSRRDDIPLLVDYFIKKYNQAMGKSVAGISQEALSCLMQYHFKGNVRELENIVERAIVLMEHHHIQLNDLPSELVHKTGPAVKPDGDDCITLHIGETLATAEKKLIIETLRRLAGNRKETARVLGISERNLRYKLKEYGESRGDDA